VFILPEGRPTEKPETLLNEALIRFGKEAVFNVNVFTRNFFTEDAIHKQNCTSFDPRIVITYPQINGKAFLIDRGRVAQNLQSSDSLCSFWYITHPEVAEKALSINPPKMRITLADNRVFVQPCSP